MDSESSRQFTQSIINIFRLNMFEDKQTEARKKRSKTPKSSSSKRTLRERERVKKIKKLISRRKEEAKKKKIWKEYLVRLAKGKLAKGEKPPV